MEMNMKKLRRKWENKVAVSPFIFGGLIATLGFLAIFMVVLVNLFLHGQWTLWEFNKVTLTVEMGFGVWAITALLKLFKQLIW